MVYWTIGIGVLIMLNKFFLSLFYIVEYQKHYDPFNEIENTRIILNSLYICLKGLSLLPFVH